MHFWYTFFHISYTSTRIVEVLSFHMWIMLVCDLYSMAIKVLWLQPWWWPCNLVHRRCCNQSVLLGMVNMAVRLLRDDCCSWCSLMPTDPTLWFHGSSSADMPCVEHGLHRHKFISNLLDMSRSGTAKTMQKSSCLVSMQFLCTSASPHVRNPTSTSWTLADRLPVVSYI